MTFVDRETSRDLGAPIALLLFRYGPGSGDVYAYTTSEDQIVHDGATFLPVPIHHDALTASGSLDRASVDVKLSKELGIAALFTGFPPSQIVTLKIYEGHVGETEFKTVWIGRVLGVRDGDNNDMQFTCEPISTSLRRSGLRRNYQRGCPHVFGGPQCKADLAANTIDVVVEDVTSPQVTLPDGWNGDVDAERYVGGKVAWTNASGLVEYRAVLRNESSTVITLNGACPTLLAGDTLSLTLHCAHTMSDCTLFDNINNYGGQPWIPLRNPIGVVNNFT